VIADFMCDGDDMFFVGRGEFYISVSNFFQFLEITDLGGAK